MTNATVQAKKITLATLKSFIRKNFDNLYIANELHFNGMEDIVDSCDNQEFMKVEADTSIHSEYRLGIKGAFHVGQSRDWLSHFDNGEFKGITVSNCCGRFTLAIKQ